MTKLVTISLTDYGFLYIFIATREWPGLPHHLVQRVAKYYDRYLIENGEVSHHLSYGLWLSIYNYSYTGMARAAMSSLPEAQ